MFISIITIIMSDIIIINLNINNDHIIIIITNTMSIMSIMIIMISIMIIFPPVPRASPGPRGGAPPHRPQARDPHNQMTSEAFGYLRESSAKAETPQPREPKPAERSEQKPRSPSASPGAHETPMP